MCKMQAVATDRYTQILLKQSDAVFTEEKYARDIEFLNCRTGIRASDLR